jgi:hypothetical protein
MTDPKWAVQLPNKMGRGYIHPETGEKLLGVSTMIKWAVAKPFLKEWQGRTVAAAAEEVMSYYAELEYGTTPETAPWGSHADPPTDMAGWLEEAPYRITRGASHDGDLLHAWAAEYHLDPTLPLPEAVPEQWSSANLQRVRQMCVHYRDLCEAWQITALYQERTVCNRDLMLAGSFDLIGQSPLINGGLSWVGDRKTTNGVKPRSDITYQLCAYAYATEMWDDAGNIEPMPDVDGTGGYVIKVKDHGASLHRVEFFRPKQGLDMVREVRNAVDHYRWAEHGDKLVSDALPHPLLTPERVAERLAAATSYDELTAVWRWALLNQIWDDEVHVPLATQQKENLNG